MPQTITLVNTNEGQHPGYGRRHSICSILFFAYVATYFSRSDMSIAVVAMTSNNSSNANFPTYSWSNVEQNTVISSYYAGLVVSSFFAGEVIRLLGPRSVLYVSFLGLTLLSAVTELCASTGGWVLLSVNRSLIGFCSGFVDPLFFYVSSKWFPLSEKNTLLNFMLGGIAIGTAVASQVGGLLAEGPTGWPSIFYLSSLLTFIFCALWKFVGFWSPRECKSMRDDELMYIEKSLAASQIHRAVKIPWKGILTSVPVYALLVTAIAQGAILAILLTQMILFIESVYKVSVSLNGLLTSLPVYSQFIWQGIIGKLSDILIEREILTIGQIRKLASIISISGNAVLIILIGVSGNSLVTTVVLMFVCYFCLSFSFTGFVINALDLSQNFSQSIVGMCRAVENASSFATPLLISALLTDESSMGSWAVAFTIVCVPCIVCNIIFLFLGKAERQSWDIVEIELSTPNS